MGRGCGIARAEWRTKDLQAFAVGIHATTRLGGLLHYRHDLPHGAARGLPVASLYPLGPEVFGSASFCPTNYTTAQEPASRPSLIALDTQSIPRGMQSERALRKHRQPREQQDWARVELSSCP